VNPPKGRILVIRGGAIGDFILTLPAIAALRQQFPEAHLEVLGYPHIVQLALAGGLVDRAQSIEARSLAGFFARGGELAEELVDYFSEFDIIVSYLYDPDKIFQTNVARCSVAQFIAGPHRPDERIGLHAAKVYLQPLERLAIFDASHIPTLNLVPPRANPNLVPNPHATLALHPGSGSEKKNWPEAKWAILIERLINSTHWNLLLVGGEAEGERLQRLCAALPPARVRVAQSLPLAELARLLGNCAAFIGHDSGISHLAAALGLPGLVLWGETREEIWCPPSRKLVILRHPAGLAGLKVEEVLANVPSPKSNPAGAGDQKRPNPWQTS
jgi:heptosyltransferase III